MSKENIIVGLIVVLILGAVVFVTMQYNKKPSSDTQQTSSQATRRQLPKPEMQIDVSKTYTATLKTTVGDIVIELNAEQTPITVNNFAYLAKNKFYDNTIFHRVFKGFMIQGGDPNGDGTGGPGYKFDDEPIVGEYTRGTIAMANSGPNTNGSQFFIMHKDNQIAKNYVIFGKVIQGINVVDTIAERPVETNKIGEPSKPVNPVKVLTVEISEK